MTTQFMLIENEAEWLAKKKDYMTSTKIPGLYGLSSYNTAFELYHITRGNVPEANVDSNFTKFGKLIEQPVCNMIMLEHPTWAISEFPYFAYDDKDKIGSSFDRIILIDGKLYLLEIKSISYAEYKKKFVEHAVDDIEASPQYEIQMQVELEMVKELQYKVDGELKKISGLVMAIFILDTRQLRYIFRSHDVEMTKELRSAVRSFWELKEAPEPDYARDKTLIARLCPEIDPQNQMDATQNNHVTALAAQYRNSKDIIKQEEEAADAAYAELLTLIGDAKYVWTNGHKISVSDIKPSAGKAITEDMVGTIQGARNGYKRLTITQTGGKQSDE